MSYSLFKDSHDINITIWTIVDMDQADKNTETVIMTSGYSDLASELLQHQNFRLTQITHFLSKNTTFSSCIPQITQWISEMNPIQPNKSTIDELNELFLHIDKTIQLVTTDGNSLVLKSNERTFSINV